MAFYILPKKKIAKIYEHLTDESGFKLYDSDGDPLLTTRKVTKICWLWFCW